MKAMGDGVTDEDEGDERWQLRKMKKDDESVNDDAEADDGDGVRKRQSIVKLDETHHHGQLHEDGGKSR